MVLFPVLDGAVVVTSCDDCAGTFDEEFDEECSVISPLLLVMLRCSIKHTDVHCMVACCRRDFLVDGGC